MNRLPIYKNIIKVSFLTLTAITVFSSCHNHEIFTYEDSFSRGENTEMKIADDDNVSAVKPGSTIGVYKVDKDGEVTFDTVEVDAFGNAVLPPVIDGSGIVAYLPYQEQWDTENILNPSIFTVQPSQVTQELYDKSDLMFGSIGTVTRAKSEFFFTHALAKIIVNITDETGTYNLSDAVLTLLDMNDSVDVYLKWLMVETITDSHHDIVAMNQDPSKSSGSFTAIVAPHTVASGSDFIKFTTGGITRFFSLPGDAELLSSKTYICSLRLTEVGLIYDGSYISDWEDEGGDTLDGSW